MAKREGSTLILDSQVQAKQKAGFKLSEPAGDKARGGGSFVVRWGEGSTRHWYFRYLGPQGRIAIPLAPDDGVDAKPLDLGTARAKARALSVRYQALAQKGGDLREVLTAEREARLEAQRAAREAAQRAKITERTGTLQELLEAYVEHLKTSNKKSWRDVERLLKLHVYAAWPALAQAKATEITTRNVAAILRKLTETGKGTTARKVRAFIRSAYALALGAESDPTTPSVFLTFAVENNPAANTAALSAFNRARTRVLTEPELRFYAKSLDALPYSATREALRLALLLGGQRPTQLLRVAPADVDLSKGMIIIRDYKGKRVQPRPHVLPLEGDAFSIVKKLLEINPDSPFLFTTDGKRQTHFDTVGVAVRDIAAKAKEDAKLKKAKASLGGFSASDIRRSAETQLAALGVSKDVRAQIQSHGLGGVQSRHYDMYEYMREKSDALGKWQAYLEGIKAAKVTSISGRRRPKQTTETAPQTA